MKYKTCFISDIHLGSRASNATLLLKFLKENEFETIFLVGDIIDIWSLKTKHYWPQSHNDVIQKLLRKARKGTNIIYVTGNHDEYFEEFSGLTFGGIKVEPQTVYLAKNKKSYLVIHGHQLDIIHLKAKWLSILGSYGYDILIFLNYFVNLLLKLVTKRKWSFSNWIKHKVKNAISYMSEYEVSLTNYAQSIGVDGIICGHIHSPKNKEINNIQYYNCGDWIENNTALVENLDGKFEIIKIY